MIYLNNMNFQIEFFNFIDIRFKNIENKLMEHELYGQLHNPVVGSILSFIRLLCQISEKC